MDGYLKKTLRIFDKLRLIYFMPQGASCESKPVFKKVGSFGGHEMEMIGLVKEY